MNYSQTVPKLVYMCKDFTFSIVVRRLSSFPVLEYPSSTKRLTGRELQSFFKNCILLINKCILLQNELLPLIVIM